MARFIMLISVTVVAIVVSQGLRSYSADEDLVTKRLLVRRQADQAGGVKAEQLKDEVKEEPKEEEELLQDSSGDGPSDDGANLVDGKQKNTQIENPATTTNNNNGKQDDSLTKKDGQQEKMVESKPITDSPKTGSVAKDKKKEDSKKSPNDECSNWYQRYRAWTFEEKLKSATDEKIRKCAITWLESSEVKQSYPLKLEQWYLLTMKLSQCFFETNCNLKHDNVFSCVNRLPPALQSNFMTYYPEVPLVACVKSTTKGWSETVSEVCHCTTFFFIKVVVKK